MKAMVLAAGLGTRLRPLTDDRPKALVEIAGRTILDITLTRLRALGIHEVIVNAHHFAGMILEYLKANDNFGMRIEVSREESLLDTGGGLKKAAYFFLEQKNPEEPFILHNVDVLSTIDLERMVRYHIENRALATLAVQDRQTSRYLLFDERLRLCGRQSGPGDNDGHREVVRSSERVGGRLGEHLQPLAFSGIHVISPRIFALMTEEGAFSIITSYLHMAEREETILAFRADEYYWRDLGRPEDIRQAARDLTQKVLP